ncbi:RDD family protein [Halobacillus massiliensis]|uniref:RDD family protein n=1 Tax=Halobacillus massiliensis TaxID=1926286 RepID=UPI0009E2FB2E|nr:RDD family protein [Halobacillus massiliensis]
MHSLTKKRSKALLIDFAVSTAVTAGVEYILRKKIKNEAFHALIPPTAVMWALEYAQLRKRGQTIGYKAMGIILENEKGKKPDCGQIVKRMAYRDSISSFDYLKDRKSFEGENGSILPHDRYAGTAVKEK